MKRYTGILSGLLVAVAALIGAQPARAGADISFGVNAPIGDDGNLFFSISSHYFDREPRVVNDWGRRFPNPDDLAVFLHICSQSRVSPDVVFRYRSQGMSWYDVGTRAGLPVNVWYVPVERDPGPPYGKAYGYWKKHERDPHYTVRLSDRECRDLVAVRMAHDYYGVSPEVAMNWRRSGGNVRTIMTREYHNRHRGDDHGHDDARSEHHHDKGHDKGHDKHDKHGDDRHDGRRH